MPRSVSSSRMSYLMRSSSPCTRRIGGEPATMCKSEAPESNISLKKASSLAISHSLLRENRLRTSLSVRVLGSQVHTRYCHPDKNCAFGAHVARLTEAVDEHRE